MFVRVANTLAPVRLGLADFADIRSGLIDKLFVNTVYREPGLSLDGEDDALRGAGHHQA